MSDSLLLQLQKAGAPCAVLGVWLRCGESGARDGCETCCMDGPEGCADTVIASLVERLIMSTHQTDVVLGQRDYWKGVSDRLTDIVIGYRSGDGEDLIRQRPRINRVFEEKE